MIFKKVKWFIVIIACLMVFVMGIVNGYSTTRLAYTLCVVVIVFAILGTIIQRIIDQNMIDSINNQDRDESVIDEGLESDLEKQSITQKKDD
jgi:ABC-type bacteriocin/lantibiotic exporter with double-glycine peptidase domain